MYTGNEVMEKKSNTQNNFCPTISGMQNRDRQQQTGTTRTDWVSLPLTDHVLPDMSHGVKLLLADLAGELLLGIAMDNLIMLV